MMRKTSFIFMLTVLWFLGEAQNWNVFNKNYRYNYKHDASTIISNVLFQDSVNQSGTDTFYYMNRVAQLCFGACPGLTSTVNPSNPVLLYSMPQFLERSLIKYSNGLIMLKDPGKLVLKPNCNLNQSWLFDSVSNVTATCIAINQQSVFGVTDSVKTILVAQQDTIRLSKSFGIISFPELYNKNKSYRLAGIENRNSYDSISLYGVKVPNAWDIYNYQVGDIFCENYSSLRANQWTAECRKTQYIILSKLLLSNGYYYSVEKHDASNVKFNTLDNVSCDYSFQVSNSTLSFPNLNSINLLENKIYPGMILQNTPIIGLYDQYTSMSGYYQNSLTVCSFVKGSTGIFYKMTGAKEYGCGPGVQNASNYHLSQNGYTLIPYYQNNPANKSAMIFASTYGIMNSHVRGFEFNAHYCKTSFKRNGSSVFGTPFVGIEQAINETQKTLLYPNPTSDVCLIKWPESINGNRVRIELKNVLGELLYRKDIIDEKCYNFNTSRLEPGIYFVAIYSEGSFLEEKKLIIKR